MESCLTIAQAARILERSPRQVREWAKKGNLTVIDTKPVRVSAESVMAWKTIFKRRRTLRQRQLSAEVDNLVAKLTVQFQRDCGDGKSALAKLEKISKRCEKIMKTHREAI